MNFRTLLSPTIRVAGAGLGAALAGPLGGAIGGYVGGAFGETVQEFTKKLGEESGKKLFETGQDSLLDSLKSDPLSLEGLYRESLRLSLIEAGTKAGLRDIYADWFAHWNAVLASADALELMPVTADQADPARLDGVLRRTLIRLDAQGAASAEHRLALTLVERALPEALFAALGAADLPGTLDTTFRALLVKPAYEQAWKQASQRVDAALTASLARIETTLQAVPQISHDTAATYQLVQQLVQEAAKQGQISDDRKAKDAEIVRLAALVATLQQQLVLRATEPTEQKLSTLIAERNIPAALALKTEQVEERRNEAAKLPRDLFELGTLHELNFDWTGAYASYKEAWNLNHDPEYGFRYAFTAQYLNHVPEAIDLYQTVLAILPPEQSPNRALLLNNLASLLRLTPQTEAAENAFLAALAIYRHLNLQNSIASTLNNLGVFYNETNRSKQAESSYNEALSLCPLEGYFAPPRSDAERALHADILNNLGNLLKDTERISLAYERYTAAIVIYRELMNSSPRDTGWRLAATLNNLGGIYSEANSVDRAEAAYIEAFRICRDLCLAQREVYLPQLALVLYNLGKMYVTAGRTSKSITPCLQALAYYRELAHEDPQTYQPLVAETLNSLGGAYRALPDAPATPGKNAGKAEDALNEAILLRRALAAVNPDRYQPVLADSLMNLAILYAERGRFDEAKTYCDEAETKLTVHWQSDPKIHGSLMAKILWSRSLIGAQLQEPLSSLCSYARQSLAAGGESSIRKDVERFLAEYCSPPSFP